MDQEDPLPPPAEERQPPPPAQEEPVAQDEGTEDASHEATSDEEDAAGEEEEEEEERVEWMIDTRKRRSNAGSKMGALIREENPDDDIDLLFAEDVEEDNEFEARHAEDDDEDDDDSSSTDDEDQAPAAGEDDLEGEEELKHQEQQAKRAEKRKAHQALLKVPAIRKKVKIVDDASDAPSQSTLEKPRKKFDRKSSQGGPIRTSSRTLSVQNKAKTIASMKESDKRRVRTLENMEAAKLRKDAVKASRRRTQAERLAEAARTEEINSKSLNKWEEMEAERVKKQKARLEAMQNRKLEGPVIRWYSGPSEWINGKLASVGKTRLVQELPSKTLEDNPLSENVSTPQIVVHDADDVSQAPEQSSEREQPTNGSLATKHDEPAFSKTEEPDDPGGLLDGIELYASLPEAESRQAQSTTEEAQAPPEPVAEEIQLTDRPKAESPGTPATSGDASRIVPISEPGDSMDVSPTAEQGESPKELQDHEDVDQEQGPSESTPAATAATPATSAPTAADEAPPPAFERSTRNLVQLINFDYHATAYPTVLRRILLGITQHSPLQPSHSRRGYIDPPSGIYRPYGGPKRPDPPLCAITSVQAKYQDPKTLLPYASVEAYREIKRAVNGGAKWSDLLGAWIGAEAGENGLIGRPANGVPEGFANSSAEGKTGDAAPAVKAEGTS